MKRWLISSIRRPRWQLASRPAAQWTLVHPRRSLLSWRLRAAQAGAPGPVENAAEPAGELAQAGALLRRSPFDIVASSVCDMVAEGVHALGGGVLRIHHGHRPARLVAGRALMILRRHQEAE